ncbi:hypothetical protein FHL15_000188 [Xylaria flabelliformis]|uniref:SigF-like NTF2-like domain-containing protein n=1 Tax=Xylaria flabelliformis TaxID=2512241 RepID=A0A553IF79_9PEZI|nr:hypothetical protein FHL15_000188 [Xylaria flabelliformis]
MENPEEEISGVIHSLTQGTRKEQEETLKSYFLPDAYFVHPFCRVPSFNSRQIRVPFGNIEWTINSRLLVLFIYQWYKIMSPEISLEVDSTAFDKKTNSLYATIRQTFTIWIVPFSLWQANVKLVCLLELAHLPVDKQIQPLVVENGFTEMNRNNNVTNGVSAKRYFIRGQQDHYQTNDMVNFVAPFGSYTFIYILQLFATFLCAVGVAWLWPVTSIYEEKSTHSAKESKTNTTKSH